MKMKDTEADSTSVLDPPIKFHAMLTFSVPSSPWISLTETEPFQLNGSELSRPNGLLDKQWLFFQKASDTIRKCIEGADGKLCVEGILAENDGNQIKFLLLIMPEHTKPDLDTAVKTLTELKKQWFECQRIERERIEHQGIEHQGIEHQWFDRQRKAHSEYCTSQKRVFRSLAQDMGQQLGQVDKSGNVGSRAASTGYNTTISPPPEQFMQNAQRAIYPLPFDHPMLFAQEGYFLDGQPMGNMGNVLLHYEDASLYGPTSIYKR